MNGKEYVQFVKNTVDQRIHAYDSKTEVLSYYQGFLNALIACGCDVHEAECWEFTVRAIYGLQ